MPHDLYASYVPRARDLVRSLGKRPLGWAGVGACRPRPDDVIQYWFSGIALAAAVPPEFRAQMDADLANSRRDVKKAVAASVPVIVSPLSRCYLDVPYAEPPADPAQADKQGRVGLRLYAPRPSPNHSAGSPPNRSGPVGQPGPGSPDRRSRSAIWVETMSGFDDLSFLRFLAWPASPTGPGATRRPLAGPTTVTASAAQPAVGPRRAHVPPR
jgi:hexosaminidase